MKDLDMHLLSAKLKHLGEEPRKTKVVGKKKSHKGKKPQDWREEGIVEKFERMYQRVKARLPKPAFNSKNIGELWDMMS